MENKKKIEQPVYYRGTSNGWNGEIMINGGENSWFIITQFKNSEDNRFKIDMYGNWQESYPVDDYRVKDGEGEYKIIFNRITKEIITIKMRGKKQSIVKTIEKGDPNFKLPDKTVVEERGNLKEIDTKWFPALDINKLGITKYYTFIEDRYIEFVLEVIDNSPALLSITPNNETIVKGDIRFKLPQYGSLRCSGKEETVKIMWDRELDVDKVGKAIYTGSYGSYKVIFTLNIVDLSKTGEIYIKVLEDAIDNKTIISEPLTNCQIYNGDWHYGNNVGITDEKGESKFIMAEGERELSLFKMTSSHSVFEKQSINVTVKRGETLYKEIHIAKNSISFIIEGDVEEGLCFYITGETKHLGEWKKGIKLNYNEFSDKWELYGNYPSGAEFKIVKDVYNKDAEIEITKAALWEIGDNHKIPSLSGYYQSNVNIRPFF